MNQELWNEVDEFLANLLFPADPVLEAALRESEAAGLPPINVSPNQGMLLQMLARMRGARAILEIGTLGGYSTIWLARALPADGRLITLEFNPKHAAVARDNIVRAGLAALVEVRVGDAVESLSRLRTEGAGPFDLIFLDADKRSYPLYLKEALHLSASGTIIVADNIVRGGGVIDSAGADPGDQGARRFLELLASEPRLTATAIQTVGIKGYDGLAIAVVKY